MRRVSGAVLRAYRKSQGMYQNELAEKLGLARTTLVYMEGSPEIDPRRVKSITEKLGKDWLQSSGPAPAAANIADLFKRISRQLEDIVQRLAELEADRGITHRRVRHGDIEGLSN